ncbi:MAG TPA: HAD-IA family hydrolase [Kineosporiaceae bacterium]|nr:HAD-IA family hydrolase [Kineosporiaceae bacterium]
MTGNHQLWRKFSRTRTVLLDFDGPVCSVFAGFPAPMVAEETRRSLLESGVSLPQPGIDTDDPMVVLSQAAQVSRDAGQEAQLHLADLELQAVESAEPTPGSTRFLRACREASKPVVIVSNNTAGAIRRYLGIHSLGDLVFDVIGRDQDDATLMKPHPHLLLTALKRVSCEPADAVMIGDSPSDLAAARAAGVPSIGFANKPGKDARLSAADAVIGSMDDLAAAVQSVWGGGPTSP